MSYLLDTCAISDFFKKIPNVIKNFKHCTPQQIYVSSITAMEIEYGLQLNPEREKKIRPLWSSLAEEIQLISFTSHCALAAAKFRTDLKRMGSPIGPYDVLIAGTAVAHGLILVTSNCKEFERVESLSIVNWREIKT